MRLALLSCGPSLANYSPGDHDGVIGVNTAPTAHPCNWWVFGDAETFMRFSGKVIGRPLCVTNANAVHRIRSESGFGEFDHIEESVLVPDAPWDSHHRNIFSACTALLLVSHLRPERLDIYGVDMAGTADFAGVECHGRNERRWAKERPLWAEFTAWVESRGIEVKRWA